MEENKVIDYKNLLKRAKKDDTEAIRTMFLQFIPENEIIKELFFLGKKSFLGIGSYSFLCLTDKQIANFEVGIFKRFAYESCFYKDVKHIAIKQPSKLLLYILYFLVFYLFLYDQRSGDGEGFIFGMGDGFLYDLLCDLLEDVFDMTYLYDLLGDESETLITLSEVVLILYLITFFFNLIFKCGLIFSLNRMSFVYAFVDRKYMYKANQIIRLYAKYKTLD